MATLSGLTNPSSKVVGANNAMTSASQPRASYFIPSFNTSNTFYGAIFLDSEFNKISYSTIGSQYGSTGAYSSYDGTHDTATNLFPGVSASQSQQSTSSALYLAGLWSNEYGCPLVQGSSRGVYENNASRWPSTSPSVFASFAHSYVNSDHARVDVTIQLHSGRLTVSPLKHPYDGRYGATGLPESMRKTKDLSTGVFPSGTAITSMWGSGSYNAVRKELVIMAYNTSSTARFDVAIWKNVDLDGNDFNIPALSNTPDVLLNVITPSWTQTDNESRYNIKPVLTDNGRIYYTVFNSSNNFSLYEIVRAPGDASLSVSLMASTGVTTSYGKEQGDAYGQRAMGTRLGNMVINYCPYYYYACGLRSFVIDRRNNSWIEGRSSNDSGHGMNPLKYRDDSFAFQLGGNYYADNWTGMALNGFASPNQTSGGKPVINTSTSYFPIAPGPNTTNYTAVYQVWDYELQSIPPAYSGRNA